MENVRVSVEGSEVERLLGELLVARSSLERASLQVYMLDCGGLGAIVRLAGEAEKSGDSPRTAGPLGSVVEPHLQDVSARLTAMIDYLSEDSD